MRKLDIFSVVLLGIVISLITTPIISNTNQIGLAQESNNVTSLAGSVRNPPNILMINLAFAVSIVTSLLIVCSISIKNNDNKAIP